MLHRILCLPLLLAVLVTPVRAAEVTIRWDPYVQHTPPGPQATMLAVQRCTVTAPAMECTPTVDLPAAVQLPLGSTTFTDTTVLTNAVVCYTVVAKSATRQTASNVTCAVDIQLKAPANARSNIN